jgi:sec-independent protein translocase protein TatB
MFEVGFTEIILILGIALVVLGPEKLPKVAADIGRWLGRARAMARQLKSQLDEEVVKADRDWSRPEPKYSKPWSGKADPAPPPATEPGAAAGTPPGEAPAAAAPEPGDPAGEVPPGDAAAGGTPAAPDAPDDGGTGRGVGPGPSP